MEIKTNDTETLILPDVEKTFEGDLTKFDFILSLFERKHVPITCKWEEDGTTMTKKVWCRFRSVIDKYCSFTYKDDWRGSVEVYADEKTGGCQRYYYDFNTKTLKGTLYKRDTTYLGGLH